MKKEAKLKALIKIADLLDRSGETEAADFIDKEIQKVRKEPEEVEVDIPEEEFDMLQKVYKAFGESLK